MYLLLLFGLIAIAVWATVITPRISLIVVCGLFLILAGLLNYDIVRFELGFTTLTVDRLMLAVLLLVFGVQWIRKKTAPRDVPASEWLLFGFLAVLVVNTFTSDWRNPGFEQAPVLPHLFEGYLIPFALYWIARRANIQKRGVDILYAMFAVFGFYLAVTAIFEVAGAWQFVFPRKIGDPLAGIHFGRARGPFLQSVRLGLYLLVSLFATWIPLVTERRWGRGGQLLGFALLGLYMAAIYATYTRSVWLGFIVAGLCLAILSWPVRLKRAVIFASILAIVGVGVGKDALLGVQRETSAEESKESTEMRAVFAYVSWKMFKDKPLTGFGFGQFAEQKMPYLNDRGTNLDLQSIRDLIHHNSLLNLLVELGLFGFVTYMAVFVAWCHRAYRLWSDQNCPEWMRGPALLFLLLMGAFFCQMAFHEISYTPLENGLLFTMAGLMSGLFSMRQASCASTTAPSGNFSWRTPQMSS